MPETPALATDEFTPSSVLRALVTEGTLVRSDGTVVHAHSQIDAEHARALYRVVKAQRPAVVVEVGMAYGASTLAILTALRDVGEGGRLISIDPNQRTEWESLGLQNVHRAGLSDAHELLERPDFLALPALLESGVRIDLAYIDGWHTFDYVLLDLWYLDRLLRVGGVMGFNDCGFRAVHRALRFLQTHRKYDELEVGLPRRYRARNAAAALMRRLSGRSDSDRYFRKLEQWEPAWNFYHHF